MTSSPSSPLLADCHGGLLSAVVEVAENSLFAFADASDQAAFDATAASSTDDGWLDARMHFTGPVHGHFTLTLPEGLARRLCAAFAGADTADDIEERDLFDFTGELANMVCGTWLTRTCQHEAFNLTPPRVRRGEPGRAAGGEPGDAATASVYLAIEDTPIRLTIDWDAAAPIDPRSTPEGADAR